MRMTGDCDQNSSSKIQPEKVRFFPDLRNTLLFSRGSINVGKTIEPFPGLRGGNKFEKLELFVLFVKPSAETPAEENSEDFLDAS